MNANDFFQKNFFMKKGKILVFFGKEIKRKGGNKNAIMSGSDLLIAKKYTTTWVFLLIPFFFSVIKRFFKKYVELTVDQLWNTPIIIIKKKIKNVRNELFI